MCADKKGGRRGALSCRCGKLATTECKRMAAGGARLGYFLRAAAQMRTRETAGANNEIIPRGGASARVLETKPSPFLMFL